MSGPAFVYRHFPASPALAPYVECFSIFQGLREETSAEPIAGEEPHQTFAANDRLVDWVIPDGRLHLSFNLGDPFPLKREANEATLKELSHIIGANTGRARLV
jgi:hypothetical protein